MRKYQEVVEAGIKLLESEDWDLSLIDLDNLDLHSWYRCPLGQLYGSYENGVNELKHCHATNFEYIQDKWAAKYGFILMEDNRKEYNLLTAEWKRQLGKK